MYLNSEAECSNLRTFSQGLNKTCLCIWILQLDCLYSSNVVKIPCVLVCAGCFWEGCLWNKVSCLFIKILLKITTNDNVNQSALSKLIHVQAWTFVSFKHLWTNCWKLMDFFISDCHKVKRFGLETIQSSLVYIFQSQIDKVTKILGLNGSSTF